MATFDVSWMNPRFIDEESGCESTEQTPFELCKQSFELKQQNNILNQGVSIDNGISEGLDARINILDSRVGIMESSLSDTREVVSSQDFYKTLTLINSFLLIVLLLAFLIRLLKKK